MLEASFISYYMKYMIRNPFIAGRPIKYGEPFCGRKEELERLEREILSSSLVVLHALRRFGKTSLLNQVAGRLEERGWKVVRFDMSVVAGMSDLAGLIDQKLAAFTPLSSKIKQYISNARLSLSFSLDPGKDLPELSVGLRSVKAESASLDLLARLTLLAKFPTVVDVRLFAVFDEFQEIVYLRDNQASIYEKLFRAAFQDRSDGFAAVFSGSKTSILRKLFSDRAKMFYRGVQPLELGPIDESAFTAFVRHHFRETLNIEIPKELPRVAHYFLEGHPYGLQKVMYLLWHLAIRGERPVDWADCFRIAVRELLESERSDFEKSWQDLTPPQRKTLLAVAMGEGAAIFSRDALSRIGLAQSTVYQAVNALVEKGRILKLADLEGNTYVVQDSIDRICLQMIGGVPVQEIVERLVPLLDAPVI
jgi:hypothetical protein